MIGKILCFFGFHEPNEIWEEIPYTERKVCMYIECSRCGRFLYLVGYSTLYV